jgi:glycosyltransferase involved in cell wall biosynthesis
MKILFIDWAMYDYDCATPLQRSLGGTQSAAAYLAAELAKRGHDVCFVNGTTEEKQVSGVRFYGLPRPTAWLNEFDVVVSISGLRAGELAGVGCYRPVIAWCQHDVNQAAVSELSNAESQGRYAGFAMVSEWQRQQYVSTFGINPNKTAVMRNAVSSPFLNGERQFDWLDSGRPPVLCYTSTPFRGLDNLLLAFPLIRRLIPGAMLRVYSGMGIYWNMEADKEFSSLYEVCRDLSGAKYVGPLSQVNLHDELLNIDMFTYPCTFRETSCISVMEACASGLKIVTTNFGALPESAGVFAELVSEADARERGNLGMFATRYANAVGKAYERAMSEPAKTKAGLMHQIDHYRQNCTWGVRAGEWESWIQNLI